MSLNGIKRFGKAKEEFPFIPNFIGPTGWTLFKAKIRELD